MWDSIKRLWATPQKPALTLTIEEQQAQIDHLWEELHAKRFEGLGDKVQPLLASKHPAIAQKALRLLGLEQFHQGNFAQAWPLFEELAEQTQTTGDWFNVATSATLAGNLDGGAKAFENAVKHQPDSDSASQPCVAMLHYFYGCALRDAGAYERAFENVEVLRAMYEKLPNSSKAQLELRGMPSVSNLLELFVDVLAESGDIPEAVTWLRAFGAKLDAAARQQVEQAVESLEQRQTPSAPNQP